ncbi:MAG: helix-turn-helix domain-containing protein [Bacteroidetes bacterium]|nr:helix-turn-helix domain-containing protein [Bacteroidota bacterium]
MEYKINLILNEMLNGSNHHDPETLKMLPDMKSGGNENVHLKIISLDLINLLKAYDPVFKRKKRAYPRSLQEQISHYKHKNYDRTSIIRILEEKEKHHLTLKEVTELYGCSRNTVSKWIKLFKEKPSQVSNSVRTG